MRKTYIFLLTHGMWGAELIKSTQMIIGGTPSDIQAFSLMPETSLKEYQQAIETAMAEHTNYDFLFLADIPGGTPYNLSACYTQTHGVEALCGLSMNLLIDVLELRKKFPCCQIPQELLSRQSTQKNYIIDLKKMLES